MNLTELVQSFRDDAKNWCVGRTWLWRAPILLFLGYSGFRLVLDPARGTIFSGITFGIHELGHVIFSILGEFIGIAGGSFSQVLAPAGAAYILLRQRDYFGVAVAGAWLSFSLYDLSVYIGDARVQQIPLLGLTGDPVHDWHYLLSKMGLLKFDTVFALVTRAVGIVLLTGSLVLGLWLCLRMSRKEID